MNDRSLAVTVKPWPTGATAAFVGVRPATCTSSDAGTMIALAVAMSRRRLGRRGRRLTVETSALLTAVACGLPTFLCFILTQSAEGNRTPRGTGRARGVLVFLLRLAPANGSSPVNHRTYWLLRGDPPLVACGFVVWGFAASVPPGRAATRRGLVQNVQPVVARGAPATSLMVLAPSVGVTR